MQYRGGQPVRPGGMGGPSSGVQQPYAKGGGPMPAPGGQQGGPPQPMPKPGGGGGVPDPSQMVWQMAGGGSDRGRRQQTVDDANMDLRQAQLSGANPMQLAGFEQAAMQAQRGFEQWQQDEFARQMSENWERSQSGGSIGTSGRGGRQQPQNPYMQMMLQNQLGMGGGRGGGGGPNNMGGGY